MEGIEALHMTCLKLFDKQNLWQIE